MTEDKKKLIRVELEFDDGGIQTLTGDDAQAWLEQIEGPLIFMQLTRGMKARDFDWTKTNAGK